MDHGCVIQLLNKGGRLNVEVDNNCQFVELAPSLLINPKNLVNIKSTTDIAMIIVIGEDDLYVF